jgi:5-methylcytosine-specific restriction enzyme A
VRVKEYKRDKRIEAYAQKWANGICQLCGKPAPFKDKGGDPYLESHHIKWLSKGGEDSPENVVALCPNCHRKMHEVNDPNDVKKLQEKAKDHA